jgi:hypothetical protein
MPIFHDPHEKSLGHPSSDLSPDVQREVEDPTSYLDLSLSDIIPSGDSLDHGIRAEMDHQSPGYEQSQSAFDRMELIERLKRTKSPLRHQRQDVSCDHVLAWIIVDLPHRYRMLIFASGQAQSRPKNQDPTNFARKSRRPIAAFYRAQALSHLHPRSAPRSRGGRLRN